MKALFFSNNYKEIGNCILIKVDIYYLLHDILYSETFN